MKAITIREAQGQLGQFVAEACRGNTNPENTMLLPVIMSISHDRVVRVENYPEAACRFPFAGLESSHESEN